SNNRSTSESETAIAINPANPLNVVGFTHDTNNSNQIQIFSSFNGGNSWRRTLLDNGMQGINDGQGSGNRADPSLRFDANGNLYAAYGVRANGKTAVVVGKSTDGGVSFGQFRVVDRRDDVSPEVLGIPAGETEPGVDKFELTTGLDPTTGLQAVYVAY